MKKYLCLSLLMMFLSCDSDNGTIEIPDYPTDIPPAYITGFCPLQIGEMLAVQNSSFSKTKEYFCSNHYHDNNFDPNILNIFVEMANPEWQNQYVASTPVKDQPSDYWGKVTALGDGKFFGFYLTYSRFYPNITGFVIDGEVVNVYVTCNRDIDSKHPAGSSLEDILSILYSDPYWVVQNKYRTYKGADACTNDPTTSFPYALRQQPLRVFNQSSHPYIGSVFHLLADNLTFNNDVSYEFTVTITTKDGQTASAQAKLEKTGIP